MAEDRPARGVDERDASEPYAQGGHAGADGVGHERSDVRVRSIVVAGAGLAVVLGVALVMTQIVFRYYTVREGRRSPSANPLAGAYGRQVPPEPRLQSDPVADLATLRARENAALQGYGWVDRRAGIARIPIERAIDLLAERGLPSRSDPGNASDSAPASGDARVQERSGDATDAGAGARAESPPPVRGSEAP